MEIAVNEDGVPVDTLAFGATDGDLGRSWLVVGLERLDGGVISLLGAGGRALRRESRELSSFSALFEEVLESGRRHLNGRRAAGHNSVVTVKGDWARRRLDIVLLMAVECERQKTSR